MRVLEELLMNRALVVALCGWAIAQILKTLIDFAINREFNFERLVGSGGMPSCHSSMVSSLAVYCALYYGCSSFEFGISTVLAIIVMYDARGVRRETGTQAAIINQIMDYVKILDIKKPIEFKEEKLKELIGHTPLQVFCGSILGIIVAVVAYNFCWQ